LLIEVHRPSRIEFDLALRRAAFSSALRCSACSDAGKANSNGRSALLRFALDIYVKIGGNTAVDQLAPGCYSPDEFGCSGTIEGAGTGVIVALAERRPEDDCGMPGMRSHWGCRRPRLTGTTSRRKIRWLSRRSEASQWRAKIWL